MNLARLPHPAIFQEGPPLIRVIEDMEAGAYPLPEDAVWRDDLPRDLAVRLALATGATMEQIEAGPDEYADDEAPATPEPEPETDPEPPAEEADLIIRHTHEDGTLLIGSKKGDGAYELIGPRTAARFKYWPSVRMIGIPQSRDRPAKRYQIAEAAKALRAAGWTVRVEIDDTPRDVAVAKADRAARLDDRYDRLTARAERNAGEAERRRAAADRLSERFAGGQPILVGHHSERGARADAKRIDNHDRAARIAASKAEWASQAASAVGAADAYRERPAVIRRRIARLESEIRQVDHRINGTRPANDWRGAYYAPEAKPATGEWLESLTARRVFLVHQLEADKKLLAGHEAAGYTLLTRETVHKDDRVFWGRTWGDGVAGAIVTRTNPRTVTLDRATWPRLLPYEDITTVECPHKGTVVKVTAPKRPAASRRTAPAIVVPTLPERPEPLAVDRSTEFFPTPPAVVARMIAVAGLSIDLDVLEPSAGLGAIALQVVPLVSTVDCVERSGQLAGRLREVMPPYCDVRCADFLEVEPNPILTYDRVLMNPPFSGEQDIRHVTHALRFVRPGGIVVAVMSAGAEFHQSKQAVAFRALVALSGGRIERLPGDAFKASGISVNTVLAVIPVTAASQEAA
jgi:predicted RNA methylase